MRTIVSLKFKSGISLLIFSMCIFLCSTINGFAQPKGDRHDFVKRGNHASEMKIGTFIIVETSNTEANAKQIADDFKKAGHEKIGYGYLTVKQLWYVHIGPTEDLDAARTSMEKYRQSDSFKNAWLLTVH